MPPQSSWWKYISQPSKLNSSEYTTDSPDVRDVCTMIFASTSPASTMRTRSGELSLTTAAFRLLKTSVTMGNSASGAIASSASTDLITRASLSRRSASRSDSLQLANTIADRHSDALI